MKPALKILMPGVHTTIQGARRTGYQDVGVPGSGPLDPVSFRLANALVGNAHETAALELLLQGPTCEVLADAVRVALVGCGAGIEVRSGSTRTIPAGESARLTRGEAFRIGPLGDSACAYLAIEGGFDVAPVLGSVSTYVRGAIGGFDGRRLQKDDLVPLRLGGAGIRAESALTRPLDLGIDEPVRVALGPQADYFTGDALKIFLSSVYTVSPQSDRMGFRLEGPPLAHAKGYNIVSDGIVPGSIQVPGSGQPIVLMADHQTIGGYPKIATVVSADLPLVARRRPGRAIRFVAVEVREAERLRKAQEAAIRHEIDALRPMAHAAQ
ncbi:MAG: biotin-dependent carboxyltransferase family protein [Betaproteobacteria bacterium]|nr:biotin-dependent carboxyltransferase family protein [Betaproteobacteria bacterium]